MLYLRHSCHIFVQFMRLKTGHFTFVMLQTFDTISVYWMRFVEKFMQ